MKKTIITITALFVAAVVGVAIWLSHPTVDSVMKDFHSAEDRAEDMLMDPLILNADLVKDRVIQDIKDPKMVKRRYAIGFLGNERIAKAIPALLQILSDESEKDYFRGDSLESIFQIDETQGRQLAEKYSSREDYLGMIAKGLLDGSHRPYERTKADAQIGRHN
jgi:hypothetical protein